MATGIVCGRVLDAAEAPAVGIHIRPRHAG
jgi:hypothetical protein